MRRAGLPFSPSEAHGIAVGILSSALANAEQQWQTAVYAELQPNDVLAKECRDQLDALFDLAVIQSQDDAFGMQLFVPDQPMAEIDAPMALRDWSQGFLFGFGLAGERAAQRLSDEGREALQDFYQIGQLEIGESELDEEEQQAVAEIEEYMRVAAMLVYEDMHLAEQPGGEHELH